LRQPLLRVLLRVILLGRPPALLIALALIVLALIVLALIALALLRVALAMLGGDAHSQPGGHNDHSQHDNSDLIAARHGYSLRSTKGGFVRLGRGIG
jgi:hypothetical protein